MRLSWCVLAVALMGAAPPERPLYFDRPLTAQDLEGRSLRELALMRNTIYARVGNPFRKRWLHTYFAAQPWYHELAAPELQKLSEVDKANGLLLEKAEQSTPREQLLARKAALLSAHRLSAADFSFLQFTEQGLLSQAGDVLTLWSVPDGKVLATTRLPARYGVLWAIDAPDGTIRLVTTGANSGVARGTWKPGSAATVEKPFLRNSVVFRAVMPATGDRALVYADGELRRVDFKKRSSVELSVTSPSAPQAEALFADGTGLVTPDAYGAVSVPLEGKRKSFEGRAGLDDFLAISSDGKTLLNTRPRHMIQRGAPTADAKLTSFSGEEGEVLALFATDDGDAVEATTQAIARYGDKGARWRTPLDATVVKTAISGNWMAVAGADHTLRFLDIADGKENAAFHGPTPLADDEVVELVLLSRALGEKVPSFVPNVQADRNPLDDVELLDQLLTVNQLHDLSRRDLKLLRHTVSARRGKAFTVPLLHDYFATKRWYHADPTWNDKVTELDKKNLKIIASVEDDLGGPLPDNVDHEVIHFGG
ncbi:MAG: YARHG domain-containing protein [Deltaproteobacteria bacterium]|nr:YARHG domain-containing protein [Deltaproteobacteria bacterium]